VCPVVFIVFIDVDVLAVRPAMDRIDAAARARCAQGASLGRSSL
jgi:hypothetical protein